MSNQNKYYSGSIPDEAMAARVYDKYSIRTLGLRAKTNFNYTRRDLINLLEDYNSSIESFEQGISISIDGTKVILNPGKKKGK
jgi:hypothetical protein